MRSNISWSDLTENLLPDRLVRTFWAFATNPADLAFRAVAGTLQRESKPIPFYIACVSLATAIFATIGYQEAKVSWMKAYRELPADAAHVFERFFNLTSDELQTELVSLYVPVPSTGEATRRIHGLVGSTEGKKVGAYLKESGMDDLAEKVEVSAERAERRETRENYLGNLVGPFILVGLSFIPRYIVKDKYDGSTLASLLYFQAFWVVILSLSFALESHWVTSVASERASERAAVLQLGITVAAFAHLLVVLFLTTSASIERILIAALVWIFSPLPILVVIIFLFSKLNSLL